MALQVGIGFSQNLDPFKAATEAAILARKNALQPRPNLAIVFNTSHYNPNEFLPVLQETLPETNIIGCSTAGIITTDMISLRGLGVLVVGAQDDFFATAASDKVSEKNLNEVGAELAHQSLKNFGTHSRKAFMYFADSQLHDHSPILKGMQEVFGTIFPLVGAGSSDDFSFQENYQYRNGDIMKNGIAGLLIGGRSNIGVGSRHGWKPLGKPRTIDMAEHNIIYTIDGQPAINLYDEYFGRDAKSMRTATLGQISILYPLGVFVSGERECLLRNAVTVDDDGKIICQGSVPNNSEVHIMLSNREACIEAAGEAALEAQTNLRGRKAQIVLVIESMTRHKLLGRSASRELDAIKKVFGHSTPIFGMYSYGEVSPTQTNSEKLSVHLKNETITIIAIG